MQNKAIQRISRVKNNRNCHCLIANRFAIRQHLILPYCEPPLYFNYVMHVLGLCNAWYCHFCWTKLGRKNKNRMVERVEKLTLDKTKLNRISTIRVRLFSICTENVGFYIWLENIVIHYRIVFNHIIKFLKTIYFSF
jgi:hypothetical protein